MKTLLNRLTAAQIAAVAESSGVGYIFHGVRGMGKALTAAEIARGLNCEGDDNGECVACHQLRSGTYPDYVVLQPEEKASITIEQVRGLVQALSLRPYHAGSTRVIVIDEAHMLTVEAQNALLKLIEEPPPSTRFILIATQLEALLPTVRSRLAGVYFAPIAISDLQAWLHDHHKLDAVRSQSVAELAEGVPGVAAALAVDDTARDERRAADELARTLLSSTVFERLCAARRLLDAKADLWQLGNRLQRLLVDDARTGHDPHRAAMRLEAVETFRRHSRSNVSPRVALEHLMLEL